MNNDSPSSLSFSTIEAEFVREAKLHGFPSPASITEGAKLDYIDHLKCKLDNIQSQPSFLVRGRDSKAKDSESLPDLRVTQSFHLSLSLCWE